MREIVAEDQDLDQFHSETAPPVTPPAVPAGARSRPSPSGPSTLPIAAGSPATAGLGLGRAAEEAVAEPQEPATFLNSPREAGVLARSRPAIAAAVGVVALLAVGVPLWRSLHRTADVEAGAAAGATGSVTFQSNPSGVPVTIGGEVRGTTPLTITLPVGEHAIEIGNGAVARQLTAAIAAGGASSYYVELPAAVATDSAVGSLEVTSDPPGAQVSVDGVRRGVTPLAVTALAAGDHRVTFVQNGTTINRTVKVAAGASASVVVSTRAADAAAAGWVTIAAPFEMKILENGSVVGTTSSNRLMLPSGSHTLELVSDDLEFTASVPVQVMPDKTVTATISIPSGLLSVNALPWAEVLIDGQDVGATPLGNLTVSVGSHEVIWRHPQFGERRRSVVVKARTPARIGVDFNQ